MSGSSPHCRTPQEPALLATLFLCADASGVLGTKFAWISALIISQRDRKQARHPQVKGHSAELCPRSSECAFAAHGGFRWTGVRALSRDLGFQKTGARAVVALVLLPVWRAPQEPRPWGQPRRWPSDVRNRTPSSRLPGPPQCLASAPRET